MPGPNAAHECQRRCRGRAGGGRAARASAARGSTAGHDEDCGAGDAEHGQRGGTPGGQRGHPARNRHGIHPARSAARSGRSPPGPGSCRPARPWRTGRRPGAGPGIGTAPSWPPSHPRRACLAFPPGSRCNAAGRPGRTRPGSGRGSHSARQYSAVPRACLSASCSNLSVHRPRLKVPQRAAAPAMRAGGTRSSRYAGPLCGDLGAGVACRVPGRRLGSSARIRCCRFRSCGRRQVVGQLHECRAARPDLPRGEVHLPIPALHGCDRLRGRGVPVGLSAPTMRGSRPCVVLAADARRLPSRGSRCLAPTAGGCVSPGEI